MSGPTTKVTESKSLRIWPLLLGAGRGGGLAKWPDYTTNWMFSAPAHLTAELLPPSTWMNKYVYKMIWVYSIITQQFQFGLLSNWQHMALNWMVSGLCDPLLVSMQPRHNASRKWNHFHEGIHLPRTPGKVKVILHILQTKIRTRVRSDLLWPTE